MTNEEKRVNLMLIKNYNAQIHLTVIYEAEFIQKLKGKRALEYYRDEMLDKINHERRLLGYLS